MTYLINDIFYTLQGEGHWTGRAAVFIRFSRCNLWTGREQDRATAACTFCDTDFTAATRMTGDEILETVDNYYIFPGGEPMVVLTGGEPLLQVDAPLLDGLRRMGFYIAVETNGTQPVPGSIDWVCVSPKTTQLEATWADELKLVYPQPIRPDMVADFRADHYWLSPMDGPDLDANTQAAVQYCLQHPQWRLNLQTHKQLGIK